MDPTQAAEALAAAVQQDAGEQASEPVAPPTGDNEQGATPEDSPQLFESINPDELPEQLQPLARQLLGDYTRKTQNLAAERKQYEEGLGGVDPQVARQAVEFYTAISTDPYAAKAAYEQLQNALEAGGYLEANEPSGYGDGDEFGDVGEDEDPRDEQLRRMTERLDNWEREQEIMQNVNLLQRQEAAIREAHPEYKKEDLNQIYTLAWAYNGDLLLAEQAYSADRRRIISSYMEDKSAVPAGLESTPKSAPAHQPREIKNLSDANAAALEYLRNVLGESV